MVKAVGHDARIMLMLASHQLSNSPPQYLVYCQSSVLWRCWLGGRKGIRPVKNWVVRCWLGYLSGARCRLAYAQLMPLPLTVSCFSKIQIGFTCLVPAHRGSPGKRAVKRVCVCRAQSTHDAFGAGSGPAMTHLHHGRRQSAGHRLGLDHTAAAASAGSAVHYRTAAGWHRPRARRRSEKPGGCRSAGGWGGCGGVGRLSGGGAGRRTWYDDGRTQWSPPTIRYDQWCIAKNGGGYTQTGVAKGLKVPSAPENFPARLRTFEAALYKFAHYNLHITLPCLFMIAEVNIRCQKNPGGWYTPYTRVYPPIHHWIRYAII